MVFDEIQNQTKNLDPIPNPGGRRAPLAYFCLETLFEIAHCFRPFLLRDEPSEKTRPEFGRDCMRAISMACHLVRTLFGTAVQRLS